MDQSNQSKSALLIAHLADTHLRDAQYATSRRGIDFFDAFRRAVVTLVTEHNVDVFVLVGDIFDKPRPSPRVIGQLMEIDRILTSAGKLMLATTGNHDWCSPTWLSTLFGGRVPDTDSIRTIPDTAAGIHPIDGVTVRFRGYTFTGIHPHGAAGFRHEIATIEAQARGVDVVLYHGFVDGVAPFRMLGVNDPLRVSEFPIAKENKAWLLGDIHVTGFVDMDRPGGKCLVGYPGSLEMCSAAESTHKVVPLIELSSDSARVVDQVPMTIRPFITSEVHTVEDLDVLIKQLEPLSTHHPVVSVKFDREVPQTINRIHSVLDAQRAVVRCYPLPTVKVNEKREEDDGENELDMAHFVSRRFDYDPELAQVALALLHRGDSDANNIVAEFVEKRKEAVTVREED